MTFETSANHCALLNTKRVTWIKSRYILELIAWRRLHDKGVTIEAPPGLG